MWSWRCGASVVLAVTTLAAVRVAISTGASWATGLAVIAMVLAASSGLLMWRDAASPYVPATVLQEAGALASRSRRRAARRALEHGGPVEAPLRELAVAVAYARDSPPAWACGALSALAQGGHTAFDPTFWFGPVVMMGISGVATWVLLRRRRWIAAAERLRPALPQQSVSALRSRLGPTEPG